MKFEIRKMTNDEYVKYLDKLDELTEMVNQKKITPRKFAYRTMEWGVKTIYGIDASTTNLAPGTLFDIFEKTVKLTEQSELDDEKNFGKSGTGELKADQDSATPAEEPLNNGAEN